MSGIATGALDGSPIQVLTFEWGGFTSIGKYNRVSASKLINNINRYLGWTSMSAAFNLPGIKINNMEYLITKYVLTYHGASPVGSWAGFMEYRTLQRVHLGYSFMSPEPGCSFVLPCRTWCAGKIRTSDGAKSNTGMIQVSLWLSIPYI